MTVAIPPGDNGAAIAFLEEWRPGGPWVLTAIKPDRSAIKTDTFRTADLDDLGEWLDKYNGKRNLYFHVNSTLRDLTKKAKKTDIASVHWLHVDIDPRVGESLDDERERVLALLKDKLPKGVPAPTVIIFSGGGYQGFWKLAEPIVIDGDLAKAEEAECYTRKLELLFGADNCHNVDRIMRLPGTVNLPDARKLKKGRVPTLAKLVSFEEDRVYPLGEFTKAKPVASASTPDEEEGKIEIAGRFDAETLEARGVDTFARVVIAQGGDPEKPNRWRGSRSHAVYFVCCAMVRAGLTDAEIMAVITDPDWPISESVLEQPENRRSRQAKRARQAVEQEFQTGKNGQPYTSQRNIRLAIDKLGVTLGYDEFSHRMTIHGLDHHGPTLQDGALTTIRLTIQECFKFLPEKDFFRDVVLVTAQRNRSNIVCDYLDGLRWDGKPRLDGWLATYGGATSTPYTIAVGSLVWIAACRRARSPGCKFDEMLVLVSNQGLNKSSAIAAMVPDPTLFTDNLPLSANSKEVIEQLKGIWIAEFAELHGMSVKRVEHVKAFQSRSVDRARAAYGRIAEEVPRSCVFIGTTNDLNFLKDLTGNRRFWPVEVETFDLVKLRADRDQLWAEASHREQAGASIRLDPSLYDAARVAQDRSQVENPFTPVLDACLGNVQGKLHNAAAWEIVGVPPERRSQEHCNRLGKAMKALGWTRTTLKFSGRAAKGYVRLTNSHQKAFEITLFRDPSGRWHIRHDCKAPGKPDLGYTPERGGGGAIPESW